MNRPLLTFEDVAEWQERLREIERVEADLRNEKSQIAKKLEAVKLLIGDFDEGLPPESQDVAASKPSAPRSRGGKPTWPSEIERIMEAERKPMTYDMLRAELDRGPLKGEYAKSEKGFYHAISRLQHRGYVSKHKGWLFRSDDLEAHLRAVKEGKANDVREASSQRNRSPMGEEVKEFLQIHRQGVESKEVISHLIKDPRFSETLNKNATGVYNVISRLVKRGEIRKEEKLLYPLKENEPPLGGSETGEGDASPSLSGQEGRGDLLSYNS